MPDLSTPFASVVMAGAGEKRAGRATTRDCPYIGDKSVLRIEDLNRIYQIFIFCFGFFRPAVRAFFRSWSPSVKGLWKKRTCTTLGYLFKASRALDHCLG